MFAKATMSNHETFSTGQSAQSWKNAGLALEFMTAAQSCWLTSNLPKYKSRVKVTRCAGDRSSPRFLAPEFDPMMNAPPLNRVIGYFHAWELGFTIAF